MKNAIETSPITNKIYIGTIKSDGKTWAKNKQDRTGMACFAVAEHAVKVGGVVECTDGKDQYVMFVKKIERNK